MQVRRVGAVFQQLPDHAGLVRERQGCVPAAVGRVGVTVAFGQEVTGRVQVVHGHRGVERVATDVVSVSLGRAPVVLDQVLRYGGPTGQVERSLALLVGAVGLALVLLQEEADHVEVARLAGKVERGLALLALAARVAPALVDEVLDHVAVAAGGCVVDGGEVEDPSLGVQVDVSGVNGGDQFLNGGQVARHARIQKTVVHYLCTAVRGRRSLKSSIHHTADAHLNIHLVRVGFDVIDFALCQRMGGALKDRTTLLRRNL